MAVLCTTSTLRQYKFWLFRQRFKWLAISVILSLAVGFMAGGFIQHTLNARENASIIKKNLALREEVGRWMGMVPPQAQPKRVGK